MQETGKGKAGGTEAVADRRQSDNNEVGMGWKGKGGESKMGTRSVRGGDENTVGQDMGSCGWRPVTDGGGTQI
jgi:hypothetical protein